MSQYESVQLAVADPAVIGSNAPILVRPVRSDDIGELVQLACMLDTMNLPRDPDAIAGIIATSETAFDRLDTSPEQQVASTYTLVATQGAQVLGTASLLSHHGTPEDPHYYLRVVEHTLHSAQLNTKRTRHVLRLEHDEEPWTEFGGLIVHPEARGQGIAKLLFAARLLLVAMHPAHFCTRLLTELLPPRRTDGGNAFWDALGGPLTGLNYYRADLLCRSDKEFISALFPHHEIVLELLPPEAQDIVGEVGPATEPARALFQRAGFVYLDTVDPFDGGPHYGAELQAVKPLQRSRCLVCLDLPPSDTGVRLMLSNPQSHQFCTADCQIQGHGLRLQSSIKQLLRLQAGNPVWSIPLDW